MLLPQGTILPNFYFFSIFLQKPFSYKNLKISSSCFIYSKGVCGTPLTPFCYFLLSSTPTIDTEPFFDILLYLSFSALSMMNWRSHSPASSFFSAKSIIDSR